MSIKSRVLAFLTCLMLGVSMISPAFVRADEKLPYADAVDEDGNTFEDYSVAMEVLNWLAGGFEVAGKELEDGFDAIIDFFTPSDHSSGGHRFYSNEQRDYLERQWQKGYNDSPDGVIDMSRATNAPLTMQDISNATAGRSLYSFGITNLTDSAPDYLAPYLQATSLSTLQISTACRDLGADMAGATYNYSYDASLYSVLASAGPRTVYTGDSSYIRRGVLDFYSRDLVTQLPLYVMDPNESSLYSGPGYDDLYDTGLNIATCATRYALLIPEHPTQSPACIYDNGILQRIDFNLYNDNIRSAYDISQPLSSILPLTGDVFYTSSDGTYTYTQNKTIGCEFYCTGGSFVPLISGLGSSGGPYSTTSVYTAFTYGIDPYPGYDDVTKILMFLSGYFRNVDIYLGDSWATATPLVGPRGFSVTPPTDGMAPVTVPSTGTVNLYEFLKYLRTLGPTFNITINNIPTYIFTPDPSQDNPSPTPAVLIPYTPVELPTPDNKFIDTWFDDDDDGDGKKNDIPYTIDIGDLNVWDGDSDDGGFGLWSKPIPDWDGNRITPAPAVEVGTRSYRAASVNEEEELRMAPAGAAYWLVKAGASFIGPIAPYIWFIVGALVVVSLVVRLLHG